MLKTCKRNGFAGWAEELQVLRKQPQELEIKLLELQNKYQAAKKTARQYKLWADGKEQHLEQEWLRITAGFVKTLKALEVLHASAETAPTFTEGGDVTKQLEKLDEQIQKLRDKGTVYTKPKV